MVQGWQEHPGLALSWFPPGPKWKLALVLLSAVPWLSRLPAQPGTGSCPCGCWDHLLLCRACPGLGDVQGVGHEWCPWRGQWCHQHSHDPRRCHWLRWQSRRSTFSSAVQQVLPPSLPPWEMQLGKVFGACSGCCELPWGGFQLQGGCWVYLCVFECVLVSLARDTLREDHGTCEGKSPGQ